jgi:hypothetical protein
MPAQPDSKKEKVFRTNRLRNWLLAFAVLALASAGAYRVGTFRAGASSKPPTPARADEVIHGLAVPRDSLDLGEIWEAKEFKCLVPLQNTTSGPIHIKQFLVSCNCSSVSPREMTIAAGETADITLRIDLTHRLPKEIGRPLREFAVDVQPIVNAPTKQSGLWRVHGHVKSRITLDTDYLQFGESPVFGEAPVIRRVVARTHVPTQGLLVEVKPAFVNVRVERRGDNRFDLFISPDKELRPGRFLTELGIDLVLPTGQTMPGVSLPIAGTLQRALRILPAQIFLGSHPIGSTAEAFAVLQLPANTTASVQRIESSSEDLTVVPAAVEELAAGRAFRISGRIRNGGDQTGTLRFIVRNADGHLDEVTVEVAYRGVGPGTPRLTSEMPK